jgi:hypothetical protein
MNRPKDNRCSYLEFDEHGICVTFISQLRMVDVVVENVKAIVAVPELV